MEKKEPFHRRYRRLLLVLGACVLLDMAIRFGTGFDMDRITPWEAGLFAIGAAAFAGCAWADRADSRVYRAGLWLTGLFALAAIRSGLWASGVSVATANLVVLVLGLAVAARLLWIRRRTRSV